MKKFNNFIVGTVFGALVVSGTSIYASPSTYPTIASWIKYTFNDEEKNLPEGYSTILYEGHTYVPARFVAEELGANVKWDEESKTVKFEFEKIKEDQENDGQETKIKYESLPVSNMINGVTVDVYDLVEFDEYIKVFLRVKNTNEMNYQFDQESTQLKLNNLILKTKDVKDEILYNKDKSWYTDITEDTTQEGYVMLPIPPEEEPKQGTLTLDVIENNLDQNRTNFTFNIKW